MLAGQILEIASFVNPNNVVLYILSQATLVTVAQGGGEGTRAVVDNLCRRQNVLRRRFHAFDCSPEFAGRARHAAIFAIIDEH